mgnify:CR=1 FL=1
MMLFCFQSSLHKAKKRPFAQKGLFTNSKLLKSYFKSFKSAIASEAFDACAYFNAV